MEKIQINEQEKTERKDLFFSAQDMIPVDEMKKWYDLMGEFGNEILKANIDYGLIQGMEKPALFKPGAEKIKRAFNLLVESIDCVKETTDFEKGFVDYTYKCIIISKNGERLGICDGNANSKEDKFRYSFRPAEKVPCRNDIAKLKIEGKGKWKKFADKWVWMERFENPDTISLKNAIQKVAQKRAFVGAVLMASGTSEFFTQDAVIN